MAGAAVGSLRHSVLPSSSASRCSVCSSWLLGKSPVQLYEMMCRAASAPGSRSRTRCRAPRRCCSRRSAWRSRRGSAWSSSAARARSSSVASARCHRAAAGRRAGLHRRSVAWRVAGDARRRHLDRRGRRAAPLPRRQRDDRQPVDGLYRDRPDEPARRRAAPRSGQPEQAVDPADRRGIFRIGNIPGMDVHWGLAAGVLACIFAWVLIERTTLGFSARIAGGNVARGSSCRGCRSGASSSASRALGGASPASPACSRWPRSRAAPMPRSPPATAIPASSIAFLARHNPLAIIPFAILLGGIDASNGLIQRRMDLPDATVLVLQGMLFVVMLLQRNALRPLRSFHPEMWAANRGATADGRDRASASGACRSPSSAGPSACRRRLSSSSLGRSITERAGRINLGLEGTLVFGAMTAYAVAVRPTRHGSACWRRPAPALCFGAVPRLDLQVSEG